MSGNSSKDGTPPGLCCPDCGRSYDPGPDEPWRCACGGPLDFDTRPLPDGEPPPSTSLDRDRGLWAFDEFLPVGRRVTLGEGYTPLVETREWNVQFKLEYVFPSGSFKDRGGATILSRAVELGVDRVLEDSSGNAGAAIAQYAARAGVDATIYVPAEAKPAKLAAIERAGADLERVEGDRRTVTETCIRAVERGDGWYASHAWNPAFLAGTATFAFETCAQRGWSAPDAVVCPLGHGTLFLGAYRGFQALRDAGWIDDLPKLLGVQAKGVAPIAATVGDAGTDDERNDLADGIQITEPARKEEILDAIADTDGDVIAIDGAATSEELETLRRAGFHVEPTSAAAPAALRIFREQGVLDPDDEVVVPLTGSGLKDPA